MCSELHRDSYTIYITWFAWFEVSYLISLHLICLKCNAWIRVTLSVHWSCRTSRQLQQISHGAQRRCPHVSVVLCSSGGQQSELECLQTQLVLYRQKRTDNHEKQEVDGGGGSAAAVPLVPCIGPVMVAIQRAPSAPRAACQRSWAIIHHGCSSLFASVASGAFFYFMLLFAISD